MVTSDVSGILHYFPGLEDPRWDQSLRLSGPRDRRPRSPRRGGKKPKRKRPRRKGKKPKRKRPSRQGVKKNGRKPRPWG